MRVYLTGFMGAGKTAVGRRVAERLGHGFVDLDRAVEALADRTIPEIFAELGEPEFRRLERRALESTLERDDVVVATGGGALVAEPNRALVRGRGTTVWLKPEFSTIMQRIGDDGAGDRPLFRDRATAEALYRGRVGAYGAADHIVEIGSDDDVDDVAGRLAALLRQLE